MEEDIRVSYTPDFKSRLNRLFSILDETTLTNNIEGKFSALRTIWVVIKHYPKIKDDERKRGEELFNKLIGGYTSFLSKIAYDRSLKRFRRNQDMKTSFPFELDAFDEFIRSICFKHGLLVDIEENE